MSTIVLIFFVSLLNGIELDVHKPDVNLGKIGFGSCSNKRFNLSYWKQIINNELDMFLWIGDAVYARTKAGKDTTELREMYDHLLNYKHYKEFLESGAIVDGVYDDHDIGVNDADNRISDTFQKESQELFYDFIGLDKQDLRRKRQGVYSAQLYNNDKLLIIMLDTRTFRDVTYIPSMGWIDLPFTAFIASYLRYMTITLFGNPHKSWIPIQSIYDYNGTVLGKTQWEWFESLVKSEYFKNADNIIIVSSIQVFTSNPYFESWGHFIKDKRKLIELLKDNINTIKTQNLIFISGDVHHSELISPNPNYPLEITSSSLTHSLNKPRPLIRPIALHIAQTFANKHRMTNESFTYDNNFGILTISTNKTSITIKSSYTNTPLIHHDINASTIDIKELLQSMLNDDNLYLNVQYPFYGFELCPLIALKLFPCLLICVISRYYHKKTPRVKWE